MNNEIVLKEYNLFTKLNKDLFNKFDIDEDIDEIKSELMNLYDDALWLGRVHIKTERRMYSKDKKEDIENALSYVKNFVIDNKINFDFKKELPYVNGFFSRKLFSIKNKHKSYCCIYNDYSLNESIQKTPNDDIIVFFKLLAFLYGIEHAVPKSDEELFEDGYKSGTWLCKVHLTHLKKEYWATKDFHSYTKSFCLNQTVFENHDYYNNYESAGFVAAVLDYANKHTIKNKMFKELVQFLLTSIKQSKYKNNFDQKLLDNILK